MNNNSNNNNKIMFWKKFSQIGSFVIATLLIILGVLVLIYKNQILTYILSNSDLTNTVYLRKIFRIHILPYELFISGISFVLVGLIIKHYDKLFNNSKKLNNLFSKKNLYITMSIVFVIFLGISLFLMFFERIEGQDEGFHLNNAKLVYEGKIPYIDFIYYKDPLFVYSQGLPLLILGFNLYGSRLLAIIFKFILLVLVFLVTKQLTRSSKYKNWYGVLSVMLLLLNFSWNTQMTIVDTSASISCIFLLFSFLSLNSNLNETKKSILTTLFFCCSIATRAFVGPTILLLLLYFFVNKKWRSLFTSIITGIIFICLVYLPFILIDYKKLYFGITALLFRTKTLVAEKTTNYFLFEVMHGSSIAKFVDVIFNLIISYIQNMVIYTALIMFVVIFVFIIMRWSNKNNGDKDNNNNLNYKNGIVLKNKFLLSKEFYFTLIFISLFLLFTFIPKPGGYVYHMSFLPIGVVLLAYYMNRVIKDNVKLFLALGIILILLSLSFSLLQFPRFRLDYNEDFTLRYPVNEIKEVSNFIIQNTPKNSKIITFEIPIAVEANRDVLHGLERGYFGYYDFDTEQVLKLNAINTELYVSYLSNKDASAVVMSQRKTKDFFAKINKEESDLIFKTLNEKYYLAKTFDQVTDWGIVEVYLPR